MVSPLVDFQIAATDTEAAKRFYHEVFGWAVNDGAAGFAAELDTGWADDIVVGGSLAEATGSQAPGLTAFIRVDDLPGALARATELGATTLVEPRLTPIGVTVAVMRSPEGVVLGLVQQ